MKILHGPTDAAGLAISLAELERNIGLESDVLLLYSEKIGSNSEKYYPFVENLKIPSFRNKKEFGLSYYPQVISNRIKTFPYILKKLTKYDIIDYTFARTFFSLPYLTVFGNELTYIKSLGKKITVTYQGCDVRRQDIARDFTINACNRCPVAKFSILNTGEWICLKKYKVKMFEKYADLIYYHNPDIGNYINKGKFRPYCKVNPDEWKPVNKKNKKIIIGHAPTNNMIKGTDIVRKVIKQLENKRNDFEYLEIKGVPYSQVKKMYEKIDIFIDQLFIGWYGGVAVELMSMEIPVLAYLREDDFKFLPKDFALSLPIVNVNETSLLTNLENLLDNPSEINKIGKQSRQFVIDFHHPSKIAGNLLLNYEKILSR